VLVGVSVGVGVIVDVGVGVGSQVIYSKVSQPFASTMITTNSSNP
jgi:hypothetical protein